MNTLIVTGIWLLCGLYVFLDLWRNEKFDEELNRVFDENLSAFIRSINKKKRINVVIVLFLIGGLAIFIFYVYRIIVIKLNKVLKK